MNIKRFAPVVFTCGLIATIGLGLAGCAEDTTRSVGVGPGVDTSATTGGDDVIPSAGGGAGNGGGTSGGGAGVGSGR